MGPLSAPFPPKWQLAASHSTTMTAKTRGEKREEEFGWGCQENYSCCQHHLPGSCQTKCHYSGDTKEFLSPGNSCEEDWELSASALPDQAVLVMVSQRGEAYTSFAAESFWGQCFIDTEST